MTESLMILVYLFEGEPVFGRDQISGTQFSVSTSSGIQFEGAWDHRHLIGVGKLLERRL